jgi:phage tail tube protein FII
MLKVYANVEGHRVIADDFVVEDVNSIALPTIEHGTNTLAVAGMVMDVDMPDMTRLKAMECSIAHNNGVNCWRLGTPGKHKLEFRVVRQKYDVAAGEMGHESVKYRVVGMQKSTDKGSVEMGNPLGSTDKFSILRYEEEINGDPVTVIDAMAGVLKINGVDYAGAVESLLS